MSACISKRIPGAMLLLVWLVATPSAAEEAKADKRTDYSIPFADHHGIRDWREDGEKGIWIQAASREWYYATFMSPCIGLPFALGIGFVTEPGGQLNRFSSIRVPNEPMRCYFRDFKPSDPPPKRAPKKKSSIKDQDKNKKEEAKGAQEYPNRRAEDAPSTDR